MKKNQKGFSVVEGLLIVVIVAILGFTGWYVYNSTNKSNNTYETATQSSQSNLAVQSPKEQIVSAVKSYKGTGGSQKDATVDIAKITIVGNNASGTASLPNEGGGFSYIAHKSNNKWLVVWEGQQAPGKDIGTKYDLPSSWYSTN